jgi:hypothetical protein
MVDKCGSDETPRHQRDLVKVINRVEPRFGSALMAYAWYRTEPLPGFSGQTAMQLVRSGRANDVLDYIDAVDAGLHA